MADAIIRAKQVQTTPAGYTVPDAQEIVVRSVRAVIDGTGAASAFTPVLELLGPDGDIVWKAPGDTTVAAGGSADVSWFPRVAAAAAASGGATGVTEILNVNSTAVAAGATTFMSWVYISGTQILDLTAPTTPKVTASGIYVVSASMTVLTNATTTNEFVMDLLFSLPTSVNTHMEASATSPGLTTQPWAAVGWGVKMNSGDTMRLSIKNRDSVSRNFISDNIVVTKIT